LAKMTENMLAIWRARLGHESYYDILEIQPNADEQTVKEAFHRFALACHPDQYIEADPRIARAAAEVFKRGVEAYRTLSRPALRIRYDANLAKGKLRYVEGELQDQPAKPPRRRALFEIAKTPRAKQFAVKADQLIAAGKLDQARVALITALQDDYDNEELKARLDALYKAIARGGL
jgi:DnaJ-class molecular chaperone